MRKTCKICLWNLKVQNKNPHFWGGGLRHPTEDKPKMFPLNNEATCQPCDQLISQRTKTQFIDERISVQEVRGHRGLPISAARYLTFCIFVQHSEQTSFNMLQGVLA